MSRNALLFSIWMGPLASALIFIAFWPLMHVFPPPSPLTSMHDFAQMFRDNRSGFLIGGVAEMCASALIFPFGGAIAVFMRRIEGSSPLWTYTMLMVFCMGYATVFFGGLMFTIAAYRPELPDEILYLMASGSFILMVCPAITGFVQYGVTGLCILQDKSANPILPRWLGYLNLWVALLSLPGQTVGMFLKGPFAWNGVMAFWIPAVVFGFWINGMMFAMLKNSKRLLTNAA